MRTVKTYWWAGKPNFGDLLGNQVLQIFQPGVQPEYARPGEADLVVCGSVLDALPNGWAGTVLGGGTLRPTTRRHYAGRVLGVRGKLSAKAIGIDPNRVVLGDVGLLADWLGVDYEGGGGSFWVPHYADRRMFKAAVYVDLLDEPLAVLDQLKHADEIVTSSLHAMVIADMWGVPHMVKLSSAVIGGRHKFDDYLSAFGETFVADQWRLTPRNKMRKAQAQLTRLLADWEL